MTALGFCAAAMLFGWAASAGFMGLDPGGPLMGNTDLKVYYPQSDWILEPGDLPFRDTVSEYPLAANLLFGAVRWISEAFPILNDPFFNFNLLWMGIAGLAYGYGASRIAREGRLQLAGWLSAGALYFSLYRYDIYPALAFLLAMWALRDEAWVRAAAWFGLCIALKGYAVVALPALLVFLMPRLGFLRAAAFCSATLIPLLASLGAVWLYGGQEAVLMPFKFHADRPFNDEAIYVVVDRLIPGDSAAQLEWLLSAKVPLAIQAGFALLAAALRPRTFKQLVRALAVAVLGFVTFGVFYSPQFVLWILGVTTFSSHRPTLVLVVVLGWVSVVFFPILFYLDRQPVPPNHTRGMLEASILVMVVLKLCLLGAQLVRRRKVESAREAPVATA
ncbi:MAG TPA: hypothetical protein VEU28_07590 [Actinomycetota bacterium]|nr:hypothetical protein [Actinomycetota bacterium]